MAIDLSSVHSTLVAATQMEQKLPSRVDMVTLWKEKLFPLVKQEVVDDVLRRMLDDNFLSVVGEAYARGQTHLITALSHQQIETLLKSTKPWLEVPLIVMSQDAPKKIRDWVVHEAKSPDVLLWWYSPRECTIINGLFLFRLLRLAFPKEKFFVLHDETDTNHTWIVDSKNNYYDVSWILPGMDIKDAYYDKQGKPRTITVSDEPSDIDLCSTSFPLDFILWRIQHSHIKPSV